MQKPGGDRWVRLAALEGRCEVKLSSFYTSDDAIEAKFRWRMVIALRDAQDQSPIVVEADSALEAMTDAIDRAEHLGWHKPV